MQGSLSQAMSCFLDGAAIISRRGYRRFIVIPLLVNIFIFILATISLISALNDISGQLTSFLPAWLHWLSWLIGPLVGLVFVVGYAYFFTVITNIISAPFFGLLAEKIECDLTGRSPGNEPLIAMVPRTLLREMTKLWYFFSRGLLVLLVFLALLLIPGVNILGTCIAALWGCWCLAIQYTDYPADNHQLDFTDLRKRLSQKKMTSLGYGGIVLVGSMVPLVNIFIPPIAVAGATVLWVREINGLKKSL